VNRPWRVTKVLVIAAILAGVFGVFVKPQTASAANPATISFQGKIVALSNGTNVVDGSYSVVFKLYTASSGGSTVWTETQGSVSVAGGVFQVSLGSVCPFYTANACNSSTPLDFTANNYYLTVTFAGDTEMSPRIQMQSVPYALNADTANKLGGLTSSQYVQLAQGVAQTDSSITAPSLFINKTNASGTPNILQVQKSNTDTMVLDNSGNLILGASSGSNILTMVRTQNVLSVATISNTNAGTAAAAGFTAYNNASTGFGFFGIGGTGYTTVPIIQNRAAISTGSAANGIVLNAAGASQNILFAINGTEVARFDSTGTFLQAGANAFTSGTGAVSLDGDTTIASGKTLTVTSALTTLTGATTGDALNVSNSTSAGNIAVFKDNTTAVATIAAEGATTFQNSTNSVAAFKIANLAGNALFNVDTTDNNNNNLLTNPSIESAIAGNWTNRGTAVVAQDSSIAYYGPNSLSVAPTAINSGAKEAVTLTTATGYTFAVDVRAVTSNFSTLNIGYNNNGTDFPCLTAQTALKNGWVRFTCAFTTGTITGASYIYLEQSDATSRTWNIDAATLETAANTTTNYHEGSIALQGNLTSPLILQNDNDSTTSLQVLTYKGGNVFTVDTSDSNILDGNAGFEVGTTGWAYSGTPGSIQRSSDFAYTGSYSLKVVTTAAAADGIKFTLASGNPAVPNLTASTNYTLSWYDRLAVGSAAFADVSASYFPDGATQSACTNYNTQVVSLGGWTRHTCTINSATAPSAAAFIVIKQTAGAAHTFYVDSVQLELGTTATAYGAGNLTWNATLTSPFSSRNTNDSTTAFQIQNSGGTSLLTVDSLNKQITVGGTYVQNNAPANGGAIQTVTNGSGGANLYNLNYIAQNFGAAASAGAFISKNSYFGEEFNGFRTTSPVADANQSRGDLAVTAAGGELTYDITTTATGSSAASTLANTPNGVEQITATSSVAGTATADEYLGAGAIGTAQKNWTVGNLPLFTAKVKMATAGTNTVRYFVGLSDMQATAVGAPTNGIYFTNCSVAAGTTCDTTLRGVTQNAAGAATFVSCGTIVPANFMYLRIEVRSATDVHFFADLNVSDGINEVECGTGSTTTIPAAGTTLTYMTKVDNTTAAISTATLQIDFVRIWQDDSVNPGLAADTPNTSATQTDTATSNEAALAALGSDDPNATPNVTDATNSGGLGTTGTTPPSEPAASSDAALAPVSAASTSSAVVAHGSFQLLDAANNIMISFNQTGSGKFNGNLDLASANVTGGLSVGGDLTVGGLSSFQKLATFFAKVIFRQDVEFDGHITVAKDSAGYATLHSGESKVHVTFATEYDVTPIIAASISNGQFGQYSVDKVDTKGFDITLKDPATADTTFSWTAVGVISPQTATNPQTVTASQ
jgi:hypothetical protein